MVKAIKHSHIPILEVVLAKYRRLCSLLVVEFSVSRQQVARWIETLQQ